MIRVVHYVNQFFGGIGGEDKADIPPRLVEGAVGPGKAVQAALRDRGEVVATVICGDNYFAENIERASEEVRELVLPYKPDLFVAGPAFNAGRYGIACGATCKMAQNELGIPAITGMYEENPGVDLYRRDVYIIQTTDRAKGMADAVGKMMSFAGKLLGKENIGRPADEGYLPRGQLVNEIAERTGAERTVDMLLAKLRKQPFESEVERPVYDRVKAAPRIKDIRSATIALVTDGGLVPKGNPDKIEMTAATRFGRYDIKELNSLGSGDYEVSHGGYDSTLVRQDPNRLVPVDAMRDLERAGTIGKLHDKFYSTTGLSSIVDIMKKVGQRIAESLKAEGVSGVILTST